MQLHEINYFYQIWIILNRSIRPWQALLFRVRINLRISTVVQQTSLTQCSLSFSIKIFNFLKAVSLVELRTFTVLSHETKHNNVWLLALFYGESTLFGSFNAELSHFDKFQTIQFNISMIFWLHTVSMSEKVLFQTVQLSVNSQFSSSWPIDRTLSGATTPGQSEPKSDANKVILQIPRSSSITRTSPSDCLVSYLVHSLGGGASYPL